MPTTESIALPINGLAAAYQPRRFVGAAVSVGWNLFIAFSFVAGGGAWRLYIGLEHRIPRHAILFPLYIAVCYVGYALLNYPLELYVGYLEERQFGLAKDGVRAWTRDWIFANAHHALCFCLGSSILLVLQMATPATWAMWASITMLVLFLTCSYFAPSLLPGGLYDLEPIDAQNSKRLEALIPTSTGSLPPIIAYGASHLRDFTGGLLGLGGQQILLVSRSTLTSASDNLLRFVLMHEMGHRRYRHLMLSTLAGAAWVALGLCISQRLLLRFAPDVIGLPPSIAWLALFLSVWMGLGEPLLAYLGRRLEYQADRFFLRQGGTVAQMMAALEELSERNLARTEGLRRRQTIFHPLPSVWNRIHAAKQFAGRQTR